MKHWVLRSLRRAALFGLLALPGLVGCAGSASTLHGGPGRFGGRPAVCAPEASADVARRLASAGETGGDRFTNTGWRMGVLHVSGGAADTLKDEFDIGPVLSVWGYQFEWLRGNYGDMNGLVDILPAVVGLESSAAIPTVNMLAGIRFGSGLEIGGGIHYSPRMEVAQDEARIPGLGFTGSIGYAFGKRFGGELRIPVNLSVILTGDSMTYCLTIGWTSPRE